MFSFKHKSRFSGTVTDISEYIATCTWSGAIDQAARKMEFSIAYNSKDTGFVNQNIIAGDTVYIYWMDDSDLAAVEMEIFRGIVFARNRNTANFTMEFTAYDRLIYLAKSKTTRKFSNITVESVIEQVANDNGIEVGSICSIGVAVDFIADNQSYSEILKKAFALAYAKTGRQYHFYLHKDQLFVVDHAETIEDYIASDSVGVQNSQHSASIEDMVNTIMIVDANGAEVGRVSNDGDLAAYGTIQNVYKVDAKQDTQSSAKALLKTVAFKASLSAVGNVQCISGYAVTVQEEQLKGLFTIKSDRHSIGNGQHMMDLDLDFLRVVESSASSAAVDTETTVTTTENESEEYEPSIYETEAEETDDEEEESDEE